VKIRIICIPTLALSKSGQIHVNHEIWWVEGFTFLSARMQMKSAASSPFIRLQHNHLCNKNRRQPDTDVSHKKYFGMTSYGGIIRIR